MQRRIPSRRVLAVIAAVAATVPLVATSGVDADVEGRQPTRVLDTRLGIGAPRRAVRSGEVVRLRIDDVPTAPGTAVLLNVTATQASRRGFVTAWSCAEPMPATSNLNFEPGLPVPNAVVLPSTTAGVCFRSSERVHLIADLTGVVTNGALEASAPDRVVDTRRGDRLLAGREYRFPIAGRGGIPTDAAAAMLNVTAFRPAGDGFMLVAPCDDSDASTLNFRAGEVVAHFTYAPLADGEVCVTSSVDTDVIIDTFGSIPAGGDLSPVSPARLVDTRLGIGAPAGPLHDGDVLRFRVAGRAGVPNDSRGATVNVVGVRAGGRGFVTVWPCSGTVDTSLVNLWPGSLRANQGTFDLTPGGDLCLEVSIDGASGVHVVVDAVAHHGGGAERQPPPTTVPPTTVPPTTVPVSGERFTTLPVGAALPSGAECAARVRPASEIRPDNAVPNAVAGSRANANTRSDWAGFARVDGAFSGTTDEIIQWAACKWGIDEDIVRAQVVKESYWHMSANGDNGESWGLGQVRDTAHASAFQYSVNARTSSAYNLDYTYASWRACYEGVYTWLNTVERNGTYGPGDLWGCVGVWFSGRWYVNTAAYLDQPGDSVRWHHQQRTWETTSFRNG